MNPELTTDRTQPGAGALVPLNGTEVVHLTAEYWPFARTGGLAEAVRGLAEHQVRSNQSAVIVLPLYRSIREQTENLTPATKPFHIDMHGRREEGQVFRYTGKDVGPRVYFVDHREYFDRAGLYGEASADYPDNLRRFAYFCRAALHALPQISPRAGVLHAHDWHAALTTPYLRTSFPGNPFYHRLATVLTVHNAAYQGHFTPEALPDIGLPASMYDWRYMEWYGHVNVLKGGLAFADAATTVSPTHAAELRTPHGGFGLHDHFISMGERFVGILNGIDYVLWNPAMDPYITACYTSDDLRPKRRCKAALQRKYGLPKRSRVPVFAMSARLVEQKGLDLILTPGALAQLDAQFIFLGRGSPRYEAALTSIAHTAPDRIAVPLAFNERLEHRLLAGADFLLMPSQFEPCGLTQMRAQRYGALPVARRVGGLADTIEDGVTGYLFDEYDGKGLVRALLRAMQGFVHTTSWGDMVKNAMQLDFSWGPSAARYQEMYHRAQAVHEGRF